MDIFTIADRFANVKLMTIKAADVDICCKEGKIIRLLSRIVANNEVDA